MIDCLFRPFWMNTKLNLPSDLDTIQSWCKHLPNFLHIEPPEPEPEPPPPWMVLGLLREIKFASGFIGIAIA